MFPIMYVTQGTPNFDNMTWDKNDQRAIRTRSALYRENSGFFGYNSESDKEESDEDSELKNELENQKEEIKRLNKVIVDNENSFKVGKSIALSELNKKVKDLEQKYNNLKKINTSQVEKNKNLTKKIKDLEAASAATNQGSPEGAAAAPAMKTPIKQTSYTSVTTPKNDAAAAAPKTPDQNNNTVNITISPESYDKFKKFEPLTDEQRELVNNYEQSKDILKHLYDDAKERIENNEKFLFKAEEDLKGYYYLEGVEPYLKTLLEELGKFNENPKGFKDLKNKEKGNNKDVKKYFEIANKKRINLRDQILNELTRSKLIGYIDEFINKYKDYAQNWKDAGNQKRTMTNNFKRLCIDKYNEIKKYDQNLANDFGIIIGNSSAQMYLKDTYDFSDAMLDVGDLRNKFEIINQRMDDLKDTINQKYQNSIPSITATHLTSNSATR